MDHHTKEQTVIEHYRERSTEDRVDPESDGVTHLFKDRPGAPAKGEVGTALCGVQARRQLGRVNPGGHYRNDHCPDCVRANIADGLDLMYRTAGSN